MLAGACPAWQPWTSPSNFRIAYAVAKAKGGSVAGLTGDANCGQCYELQFAPGASILDPATGQASGGAHPDIVGQDNRLLIQVVSVEPGADSKNSFEIYIPGAGLQTSVDGSDGNSGSGCGRFYNDKMAWHFDCGQRYTGCNQKGSCAPPFPQNLRQGCEWKFDWLKWLENNDATNNPFVNFKRVKCPRVLVDKTRTEPQDDHLYEVASWTYDDHLAGHVTEHAGR